jgi:hypothetical protein
VKIVNVTNLPSRSTRDDDAVLKVAARAASRIRLAIAHDFAARSGTKNILLSDQPLAIRSTSGD